MKFIYHIIITKNNKQVEFVSYHQKISTANAKFFKLKKENEKIIFPMKYINEGRKIQPVEYSLVLIKKREENENKSTLIRNNYGEFVEHETNNDDWIVIDKIPYYKEETFWVYGFHPLIQRKTYDFIYKTLIEPNASKKETFLNVIIYKNKLLLETTNHLDLVICKNKQDCIRLYNKIQEDCIKNKMKYILFNGDWTTSIPKIQSAVSKIKQLTNWNDLKIKRNSTRP